MYEFPAVEITGPTVVTKAPLAATKSPSSAGDSFPVWPLAGGLTAFALASGAALLIRRRQLRPSH
jgi:LPXTG-motif cell wall-anchored protein